MEKLFGKNRANIGLAIIQNFDAARKAMTEMANIKTDNYFHPTTSNLRLASPKEIANIALFLASDLGNNMIGSIVVSDGGEMHQDNNNRY